MEEQLISFDTSKLARDKGFNQLGCKHLYHKCGTMAMAMAMANSDYLMNAVGDECAAMSQSILQKWLRDKHKIHIIVNPTLTNYWTFAPCNIGNKEILLSGEVIFNKYDYNTYEEALEAGLTNALNLL